MHFGFAFGLGFHLRLFALSLGLNLLPTTATSATPGLGLEASCMPSVNSTTRTSSGVMRAIVDVVAKGLEDGVRACSSLFLLRARGVTPKNRSDARNALMNFILGGEVQAHGQMHACLSSRKPAGLYEINE